MAAKPLRDLTVEDLQRVPVWIYDGRDDETATVTPTDRQSVSIPRRRDPDPNVYIARTTFTLADGSTWTGFMAPGGPHEIDITQPTIIGRFGLAKFWFDDDPDIEALLRKLGLREADVFPVRFRCDVPIDGKVIEGQIDREDLES